MSSLDLMPLFNRAVAALRDDREIATTMQVVGAVDATNRVMLVGIDAEARQRAAYAFGQGSYNVGSRTAIVVCLAELPRTAQLALVGQYADPTLALVVASMERDRKPRCVAQPYTLEDGRRLVNELAAIAVAPPAETVALLGRFWDGVEEREKVASTPRPARSGRFRR